MTYDAGRIEATADLNRDPFQVGIEHAVRLGEDFAAHRFTASADLDVRPAEQALDRLKAKADNFGRQKYSAKVDIDVTGNVRFDALIRKAEKYNGTVYKAKVVLDAEIAFLKLDDIEARLKALATGRTVHTVQIRYSQDRMPTLPSTTGGRSGGAADSGGGAFSPMGTLIALAPALLPLLPLAGALIGEFGALGAAGMLAFKGIQTAEKSGTVAGNEFLVGIRQGKQDLSELEATAARGVLAPFSRDVALLNREMPFLNAETGKYATILGNTSGQLLEGAIKSVHVLDPLLSQVSGWVYSIAAGFNRWAGDGGLQRFEDRALQVLPTVERDITDIATAVVDVTRAFGPFGMGSLRALDMIAKGIDGLPLPVLKALVAVVGTGYLAFQAWNGLSPVIGVVQRLTTAIKGYEAAQLVAGGASKAAAAEQATVSGGLGALATRYGSLGATLGMVGVVLGAAVVADRQFAASNQATAASANDAATQLMKMVSSGEILRGTMQSLGVSSGSLKDVLKTINDPSIWNAPSIPGGQTNIFSLFDKAKSTLGFNTATHDAQNFFKSVDDGLSEMMIQGNKTAAQNAFKIISDQAKQQGISVDELLAKLPHYKAALDSLNASATGPIMGLNGVLMATDGSLGQLAARYHLSASAAQAYAGTLGITADMVKYSTVSQDALAQAVEVVTVAEDKGTQTTSEYVAAVNTFAQSAGTAADRAALIGATLKAANGDALGYANTMVAAAVANQQLVSGLSRQERAAINLKTGVIDYRNAAAGPLLSALQGLQTAAMSAAGATYQHELATKGAKQASDDAATAYYAQTHGALIAEARQLGLTSGQAKRLADQYFSLPKDIKTRIEAIGTDPVLKVLDQIGQQLSILTGHRWVSAFNLTGGDAALATVVALQTRLARLNGSVAYVQVNERTVGGGASGGRQVFNGHGNIVKFGFGGFDDVPNNHQPAIYPVRADGRARVFAEPETQGEVYAPLANDHRRPRAKAIISQAAQMMGGAAFFADGGFGFVGVTGPAAPGVRARRGGTGGSGRGAGGSVNVATSFNGRLYSSLAAAEAARATLADSLNKAIGAELAGLGKLAGATEATVTTAMGKILATVRQTVSTGFGPSRLVASLQADSRQLIAEVAARTRIAGQLAAAEKAVAATRQQMATTTDQVAQGIMGGFDFGTAGNGYSTGITSTLDQRVADAKKFLDLENKAKALGLNAAAVDQIAKEGPQQAGANLQAIVTAGAADSGYIAHLNSQYATLGTLAKSIGASDADNLYGKQLAAQQAVVARDTTAMRAEQRAIHTTLLRTAADLKAARIAIERQAAEAHRLAIQRAQQGI